MTTGQRTHGLAPLSRILAAAALLLVLGQAARVFAQWVQPQGSSNINNTNTGNVGVGTASPEAKLDLVGSTSDNTAAAFRISNSSGAPYFFARNDGRIGLGTTAPQALLHLWDADATAYSPSFVPARGQRITNANATNNNAIALRFSTVDSNGAEQTGAAISGIFTSHTAAGISSDLAFQVKNGGAVSEALRINSAGRIGIGTSTPAHALDVQGGAVNASGGLCIAGACKSSWSEVSTSQWASGASGSINYGAGNVGIGTANPAATVHIYGTGNDTKSLNIDAQGGGGLQQASINFLTLGDGAKTVLGPGTKGWHLTARGNAWVTAAEQNDLQLYKWDGASAISFVQYWDYATGNVGIGTSAPTERLHVAGNLKVTGNIEARYQDVAEWVPTTEELVAGTVVVLDPSRANHVLASASSYDTSVAGVVSAQPGIILGEGGEGKVKVATTGRVRVRVDATKGPIKIGDLLVTSDMPGVAMKSEPMTIGGRRIHAPGTIIGKALEPLAGGTGEILVLLSMQ